MNPEHVTLKYMMVEDLCLVVRKMDLSLETRLRGISKLALQCSLKGIVPKDSVSENYFAFFHCLFKCFDSLLLIFFFIAVIEEFLILL